MSANLTLVEWIQQRAELCENGGLIGGKDRKYFEAVLQVLADRDRLEREVAELELELSSWQERDDRAEGLGHPEPGDA